MSRYPQPPGDKGSLRWIQEFVNKRADELDAAIMKASGGLIHAPVRWLSPLEEDDFAEYRDQSFLDRLGIALPHRHLESFWPQWGPQWDALGRDDSGAIILVEAKANVREVISSGCRARAESKEQIDRALEETARHFRVGGSADWSGTFYQYANRLAHLYLLHELNEIDAWMLCIYFTGDGDVHGPETAAEWQAAIQVLHGALGLGSRSLPARKVDVYLDVRG